jgi:pyruvate/2-oxoglutarate dehydrogenase complex dihydrolipoamide dehydrogenase (E3) component
LPRRLSPTGTRLPPAVYRVVPHITFTDPEIASVGLTEEQARQAGHRVVSGKVEIRSLGKALVDSDELGLVKLVADATSEEILGGHIVAPAAGEMIHEIVVAMKTHARIGAIAEAIHAYPTLAEGIKMAASDWLEKHG